MTVFSVQRKVHITHIRRSISLLTESLDFLSKNKAKTKRVLKYTDTNEIYDTDLTKNTVKLKQFFFLNSMPLSIC